jgi:hypothetical protein
MMPVILNKLSIIQIYLISTNKANWESNKKGGQALGRSFRIFLSSWLRYFASYDAGSMTHYS